MVNRPEYEMLLHGFLPNRLDCHIYIPDMNIK